MNQTRLLYYDLIFNFHNVRILSFIFLTFCYFFVPISDLLLVLSLNWFFKISEKLYILISNKSMADHDAKVAEKLNHCIAYVGAMSGLC